MSIAIAGAPVSFGVFELTPDDTAVELPGPDTVAEILVRTGYTGIDLGPVGFLGRGVELRDRLSRHSLELAGGWIDLPFSDDEAFAAGLPGLEAALDVFSAALDGAPSRAPLPTLADSGSAERKAHPGGAPGLSLDEAGWDRFAANVAEAARRVRARGLEPTFHHHACTFVETPDEVDAFLERTDVDLTFDTGHLLIGGGDPLAGWRRWASRINHLHLKDVRVQALRDIVHAGGGMIDVWSGGTFVPFGAGDLDMDAIMTEVLASGFDGWLVVEQDLLPGADYSVAAVEADHLANRTALRHWL